FSDADAFPCIVWGGAGQRDAIRASRITQPTAVADALARIGFEHPRERWATDPWHIDDPDDVAPIDRIAAPWPRIPEAVPERPSRGVVTGCNRAFVIEAATRERLLADEPEAATLIRPFIKGRDVRRWQPATPDAGPRYILLVDRGTSLAKLPRVRAHLAQF